MTKAFWAHLAYIKIDLCNHELSVVISVVDCSSKDSPSHCITLVWTYIKPNELMTTGRIFLNYFHQRLILAKKLHSAVKP